jgi:MFS transporter, FLVCR family, feline leukemia virus subgroup C receptor-related protein
MIRLFNVSTFSTTLLVLVFNVLGVPLNFPSNYLMDKYGIQIPTIIASVCFVLGAWVRYGCTDAETGFYWILAGQTIAAAGIAFVISGPSKVAMVWFGDKERAIATTIGALSIPLGNIFGFVLPIFFFRDIEDNEWNDI